jgi:7,8-dihydropterin-6-yl-methyl-4-(beta-D-ribofuranosyl)aminobenzene 5'-phosphate synthase
MADTRIELTQVDRLSVQVLVDNVTDSLSTNPSNVLSELACHVAHGLQELSGRAICCAHHGLSLVLRAESGERARTLLFDAGPEDYAVARNGALLKVDFGAVEAMVLSHGHWDHGGGMLEAVRRVRAARPDGELRCYLHPGMFRQRGVQLPSGQVVAMEDVPRPDDYRAAGCEPVVTQEPTTLLEGSYFVSGEIPRVTEYEKGLPGHVARDRDDGPGEWEPDPWITDERFVAVHVKGCGLVVFSACSHAGLINVLTEARNLFPDIPLHAVMGGFHLSGATVEQIIPETVRDLAQFEPRFIVPSHCTGWRALTALVNAFGGERVVPNAVGKLIVFSA